METLPAAIYRITVKGKISPHWSDWFEKMKITSYRIDGGQYQTTLTGPLDRAALYGTLIKILNLNLELLSVQRSQNQEKRT